MAVHPVTQDVYLSVSRGLGDSSLPAVVKVTPDDVVSNVDLPSTQTSEFTFPDAPTPDMHFRDREHDWPVPAASKYQAKAQIPVSTLTKAHRAKWKGKSGIFITNGHVEQLPEELQDAKFQDEFLKRCRELASR